MAHFSPPDRAKTLGEASAPLASERSMSRSHTTSPPKSMKLTATDLLLRLKPKIDQAREHVMQNHASLNVLASFLIKLHVNGPLYVRSLNYLIIVHCRRIDNFTSNWPFDKF